MKKRTGIIWLFIIGLIFLSIGNNRHLLKTNFDRFNNRVSRYEFKNDSLAKKVDVKSSQDKKIVHDTPVESLVDRAGLKNTYYYNYESSVPEKVRPDFEYAVSVYNKTGIVKLLPGKAPTGENQITFGTYNNKSKKTKIHLIELGHGGIDVNLNILDGSAPVNHGFAKLNLAYSSDLNRAVAVHELGHALGLAHSDNVDSVTHPVEMGQTKLIEPDIKALQKIYNN